MEMVSYSTITTHCRLRAKKMDSHYKGAVYFLILELLLLASHID